MALRGNLDDVPVVDVLQFIHLSGKSGTLVMNAGARSALIEFADGNIVYARAPSSRTLGRMLVERQIVSESDVTRLLDSQRAAPEQPPLGRLIVDEGLATFEELADCVRKQIEEAMLEIALWKSGEFQFHQSRIETVDSIRVDVEDLLPAVALNTQFFLLEAMRLVDERVRETPTPPTSPGIVVPGGTHLPPAPIDPQRPRPPAIWAEPTLPPLHAQGNGLRGQSAGIMPVGLDQPTLEIFAEKLAAHGYPILGHVPTRFVHNQFLGERRWPGSMVLLWRVRGGERGQADETLSLLTDTLRAHPGWTILTLVSGDVDLVARCYQAGARIAIPIRSKGPPSDILIDAVEAIVERIWRDNRKEADAHAAEMRAWLAATRLTSDMHHAVQRSSVALELMRVAAQVLDRAVLFLAKGDSLIGLGAFGRTANGRPMAEAMRGLALDIQPDTPLARGLVEGTAHVGAPSGFGLGQVFFELAGEPALNRGVLIPLVGPGRAIGVLYGDNGSLASPLRGVHTVELAAAQAALAYENAILRRRLDDRAGGT